MSFLFIFSLIALGLVASSDFIENKLPASKVVTDFIKPFSGWIGLVSMVLGLFWLIRTIRYLGPMLNYAPVRTLISVASMLILIVLGFVMAKELIKQFSSKSEGADGFVDKMNAKFSPLQEKLGLGALGLGLVNLLLVIT